MKCGRRKKRLEVYVLVHYSNHVVSAKMEKEFGFGDGRYFNTEIYGKLRPKCLVKGQ